MKDVNIRGQLYLIGLVPILILGFAELGKLWDVSAFARDLATWDMVPDRLWLPLAYAVPTVEIAIALGWILGVYRRSMAWGGVVLFFIFAAVYGVHLIWFRAPTCGCFGKLVLFNHRRETAPAAILMNVLLGIVLAASTYMRHGSKSQVRTGSMDLPLGDGQSTTPSDSRAFTLLETLLVILLIGLLVSLTLPSLGGVRRKAGTVASLSNLRGLSTTIQAYSSDWNGQFPFFTDPTVTYTVLTAGDHKVLADFFDAKFRWNYALANGYFEGNLTSRSFFIPGDNQYGARLYLYSTTCFTRPEFWDQTTRTGPDQFKPVRLDEVTFPSQKGIFVGNPGATQGFETSNIKVDLGSRMGPPIQ